MGGCAGKPGNKVNPPLSNGELANSERQVDKRNNGNPKARSKITSIDGEVRNERNDVGDVENNDKNSMGLETSKNTPTNNVRLGRHTVVGNQHKISEQSDIDISSLVKDSVVSSVEYVRKEPIGHIQESVHRKPDLPRKAVRFDINFVDMEVNSQPIAGKFPRRLKKLEGLPQLTAEQLRRKQEQAEQNRAKELQRKTETSSKHNRDLFQAREFERIKNAQIQMEQKFLASERNRKNHVKEVINKQLEREKKARKVREKSCVELEGSIIHVDETYSSDGDSEDEDWGGTRQDKRCGTQDEDSADDFYESCTGRAHLYSLSTQPFVSL